MLPRSRRRIRHPLRIMTHFHFSFTARKVESTSNRFGF
jgi:hypothetical protein